jgi:hypothetical protein
MIAGNSLMLIAASPRLPLPRRLLEQLLKRPEDRARAGPWFQNPDRVEK